ncbi:MAG: HD domain-containing protein [Clostridia bacterium]|nr:HD domain-containing protein [Clostridia bacterium]
MNFKVIDEKNSTVQGYALVRSCEKKTSKNGSFYLDIILSDSDGEINAKVWDYKGDDTAMPIVNTVILVRGIISTYNNAPQMRIDRYRQSEERDNINMADFVPSAAYSEKDMLAKVHSYIDSMKDEDIRRLCNAVIADFGEKMSIWPAAYKLHHAIRGGLLMHTLSIMKMADAVASLYASVDRDLLLCGALLHDVEKLTEYNVSSAGLVESYTVRGTLVGHLVGGAMLIENYGKKLGLNPDTVMLIQHMIASHHGEPEYGAAVRPLFLEAEILSQLDLMDANIYEINAALGCIAPGEFTSRMWSLQDRKFYHHGRKTVTTDVNL